MAHVLVTQNTHLLLDLLLHLLQVGSHVHADLVLGAQQSLKHLISGQAHFLQSWLLHTLYFYYLKHQVFNLRRRYKHCFLANLSQTHFLSDILTKSPLLLPLSLCLLRRISPRRLCQSSNVGLCIISEEQYRHHKNIHADMYQDN